MNLPQEGSKTKTWLRASSDETGIHFRLTREGAVGTKAARWPANR
jgi:hypothetical protein